MSASEVEQATEVWANTATWVLGVLALLAFLLLIGMVLGRMMRGARGHGDDPYEPAETPRDTRAGVSR